MHPRQMRPRSRLLLIALVVTLALLPACSVKESKSENGTDKKVSIQTPVGNMNITTEAKVEDVGLPVYPGAQLKPKSGREDSSANVNISSPLFGVRVVVLQYLTDDSPAKVAAFYKKELARYGTVLECQSKDYPGHFEMHKGEGDQLTCEHSGGSTVELKVGTKDRQHVVAIKPASKGAEFALVYVSAHGKDESL